MCTYIVHAEQNFWSQSPLRVSYPNVTTPPITKRTFTLVTTQWVPPSPLRRITVLHKCLQYSVSTSNVYSSIEHSHGEIKPWHHCLHPPISSKAARSYETELLTHKQIDMGPFFLTYIKISSKSKSKTRQPTNHSRALIKLIIYYSQFSLHSATVMSLDELP